MCWCWCFPFFPFLFCVPRLVSRLSSLSSHSRRHLISISLSPSLSSHLSEPQKPRCCGACVRNISTDEKLVPDEPSFLVLGFVIVFIVAGGQEPMTVCPGQRKPDSMRVKTRLQCVHHDGMWPNQEPPCRVYHLMMKCLHCCRNLGFNEDHIRIL